MTSEPGRYHLKPTLEVQRVVKYTAPGFDTLFELSEGVISWEVAKARFDALYQSDPSFIRQVDPEGLGFPEVSVDKFRLEFYYRDNQRLEKTKYLNIR